MSRQSEGPYLASATVTDEDELEGRGVLGHVGGVCVRAESADASCEVDGESAGSVGVCCYD